MVVTIVDGAGLLWVLAPIMTSAVLMLVVAIIGNNAAGRVYPQYWIGGPKIF